MFVQEVKKYKGEHGKWKLASDGAASDVNAGLIQQAHDMSGISRVTYVEANLMRHLRKEKCGQMESNAIHEYLERYPEVTSDSVHNWLFTKAATLFKKCPPLVKTDAGLVPIDGDKIKWKLR